LEGEVMSYVIKVNGEQTDKPGSISTAVTTASTPYQRALPDAKSARLIATTATMEPLRRTVLTHRTQGVVAVRIGLAEFPRSERSTTDWKAK
jgi:hypothetical protein